MTIQRFVHPLWADLQNQIGFSQAVREGNLVHIAGTAAMAADGSPVHPGDMNGQIGYVYDRIGETLEAFGLTFENVVREVTYTTDLEALLHALPVRRKYYAEGAFPASTGIQVHKLVHPDLVVEIEFTAAIPS